MKFCFIAIISQFYFKFLSWKLNSFQSNFCICMYKLYWLHTMCKAIQKKITFKIFKLQVCKYLWAEFAHSFVIKNVFVCVKSQASKQTQTLNRTCIAHKYTHIRVGEGRSNDRARARTEKKCSNESMSRSCIYNFVSQAHER